MSSCIKLLMNSLVGKACAQGLYWQDCPDEFWPDPWSYWYQYEGPETPSTPYRTLAWRVQREVREGEGDESVPALAAYVYSLGRVQLWEWLQAAGEENVYYCDTDSLWTNEEGYGRLCTATPVGGDELGCIRLVSRHPWARFHGWKHYETPSGLVCAGIPPGAVLSTDGGWEWWTADSPVQSARRGEQPTKELIRYSVGDRVPYCGGKVGAGGTVYPWEVYQDEQTERVQ